MTPKEEREAIRTRHDKNVHETRYDIPHLYCIEARKDVFALLDDLDEAERENARLKSRNKELNEHMDRTQADRDEWKKCAEMWKCRQLAIAGARDSDRDRLKRRAEALEEDLINERMNCEIMTKRAEVLERAFAIEVENACDYCVRDFDECPFELEECDMHDERPHFQFDEARFAGGSEQE